MQFKVHLPSWCNLNPRRKTEGHSRSTATRDEGNGGKDSCSIVLTVDPDSVGQPWYVTDVTIASDASPDQQAEDSRSKKE